MKTIIKSIIKYINVNAVKLATCIIIATFAVTGLACWAIVFNTASNVRKDIITDGFTFKVMAGQLDRSREFMKTNWDSWTDKEKAIMARRYVWSAAKIERSKHLFEDQPGFDEVLSASSIHSIKCINTNLNVPLKDQAYFAWWWDSTYIELGNIVVNSNNTFRF